MVGFELVPSSVVAGFGTCDTHSEIKREHLSLKKKSKTHMISQLVSLTFDFTCFRRLHISVLKNDGQAVPVSIDVQALNR